MPSHEIQIAGLFPAWDTGGYGGVQSSGREAWKAISTEFGERNVAALHHQAGASKAETIVKAVRWRPRPRILLVWHMHLLKLLPFLETSGTRVILYLHGIEAWLRLDSITRFLLRKVSLVLANSNFTWDRFITHNPEFENLPHRTVPLGLGEELGADTPEPSPTPAVLMVGRLDRAERYKGHEQMIAAWPAVLTARPGAELWIAGTGNFREELESTAYLHLARTQVRFLGEISDPEKERLIASSRCLALPSRGEGFGLVYLEAMRQGRPCLVGNADAGREVIDPPTAGLAVDPSDTLALTSATIRMLTEGEEWGNWSDQARRRYEWHFTSAHFCRRLLGALAEA